MDQLRPVAAEHWLRAGAAASEWISLPLPCASIPSLTIPTLTMAHARALGSH